MNDNTYKIWFSDGTYPRQDELVGAMCVGNAIILSQAIRIKAGKDITVESIEQIDG